MADEQTADPSPAPLSPTDALAQASPEAIATWRQTGELPVETPAPEPEPPGDEDTPATAETPPATPASPEQRPALSKRQQDINDKIRKAVESATAETKAELARLRAQLSTPAAPAQPQTPSRVPTAASDPEPDPEDTAKYPDGLYDRKFMKDQANWEARQVLREREEAAVQRQREYHAQQVAHERLKAWGQRVDASKAKHPDWEEKIATVNIVEGSPIDIWVMESPLGAELLYGPLANPAEVRRIEALPALQQVRELAKLELSLEPAPAKTITDAPDPPRILGDRSTSPVDAVDRAIKTGDIAAFLEAENRRELGLWKASHGR